MKKSTILAIAAAAFIGQGMVAQDGVKEITYVEDATQGYLFNRFKDNWFITGEVGFANSSTRRVARPDFGDRFAPAAGFYVGKYFSPIIGLRLGLDWFQAKGQAYGGAGVELEKPVLLGGYYSTKTNNFGLAADFMISLTNWWCGYNPDRVFNAQLYAGVGGYMQFAKTYDVVKGGLECNGYHNAHDEFITARLGLLFDFNITKNFTLGLDLRAVGADKSVTQASPHASITAEALLAVTYKFNKSTWSAPVVAVIPEIEDCEPLRARLAAADARIEDLEAQLRACLNRPVEKVVEKVGTEGPLATVFFPIGVSRLSYLDTKVLSGVAEQIIASGKKYTITGWADNYTGTAAINDRLREQRAKNVEKELIRLGVPADRLSTSTNNGDRISKPADGIKYVSLDRCATITENK